ncbi:MAG: hypothetical protein KBF37_01975 [Saprospiraceae bacterium]|nr:hypothetical protein [Saprospiraceae bacterium]MBP9209064.1 hypothetical protein [Saprospiraceae bacterium]
MKTLFASRTFSLTALSGILFTSTALLFFSQCRQTQEKEMAAPAGSSGPLAADAPKGIFLAALPAVDTSVAKLMVNQWGQIVGGLRNVQSDSIEHAVIFPRTSISNLLQSIPDQGALVIHFGNYADTPAVRSYLQANGKLEYLNKFSVILAVLDSAGKYVDQPLVNLGGLCPPDCPKGSVRLRQFGN